jgi:hypothetical protein
MFEEGHLLKFTPFFFKNAAFPKSKYFIVIKTLDDNLILASLPTSKDHVPTDIPLHDGCIDIPDRMVSIFVLLANKSVAIHPVTQQTFCFPFNTFIYGADLDTYPLSAFVEQIAKGKTVVELIGKLEQSLFDEIKECLRKSKMVKNKYRRMM